MSNCCKWARACPGLGVLGLALFLSAQVEGAAETSSEVIEEVTVTATRTETNLMKTAIAVSAFDQDELSRNGVLDIRDASDLVPNFDVAFSPSDSGVQLTIRGINSNNFTELGDPSVAFHVDGVYSPRPQGATALMFDLERLEVMRGPQGTLFGRNSAAGSVNVITAKPTFDGIYATIGAEVGNYGQRNLLGTMNLPLLDTLALRFNFFEEERGSWIDQDAGTKDMHGQGFSPPDGIPDMDQRWNHAVDDDQEYGAADRYAYRVSALWVPTERFDWRLTYEVGQDNNPGWAMAPNCEVNKDLCRYNGGSIDYIDPNVPGFLDMTQTTVRSHMSFALTDTIEVIYNAGWARQEREQRWDGDMGWRALPGLNTGWLNRNPPWPSLYLATAESQYDSWSHEIQFQGLTGRVNWIVGLFDFREDNSIIFDVEQPFCCNHGGVGGISFVQPERTLTSQAVFGQATWHVTDRLHLTAGYRYTSDKRQDKGGRNIGCYGGGGCSWSNNRFAFDGHPQTTIERNELFLPLLTSQDINLPGLGSQNRFENYETFDMNDNKEDFEAYNWRLGVDYDFSEDIFAYAYAATGSKAGAFGDGVDVCRCGRIRFFPYKPEEVLNYEIGIKASFLDRRLNVILTSFVTDFQDKQVSQFRDIGFVEDPPGTIAEPRQAIGSLVTSNAGQASIRGIEFEFDYIPWENGRFSGGLGLLDATFDAWPGYAGEAYFCEQRAEAGPEFACVPQDDGSGSVDIEGNKLPYAAPYSWTLEYSHHLLLPNGGYVAPRIKLHGEGDTHMTEGNFDAIPALSDLREAYATVDLSIRYTEPDENWNIEAFVYNATNERFQTYYVGGPSPDVPMFAWNRPRAFGLKATWSRRP